MLLVQNQKSKNYFEITTKPFVTFEYSKLIDAIEYLNCFVKDEPERIFSSGDHEAFLALVFIAKNISVYKEQINFEIFLSNNFDATFTRLLMRLYEKRDELDFEASRRHVQVFTYLLFVINDTLLKSIKFCHRFVQNGGFSACLLFLGDEQFITRNLHTKIAAFAPDISPARLADILTMIITNLVMTCDTYKSKWSNLRAVEILLRIALLSPSSKFNVYTTIPFILNDEHIESSSSFESNVEINAIIDVLVEMMANARKEFDRGDFNRLSFQIVLKDRAQNFSIHFVRRNNGTEISLDYLLDCLFKLAVNDKVKEEIYFRGDMGKCLKTILERGFCFCL
jgi:hypothetical protein